MVRDGQYASDALRSCSLQLSSRDAGLAAQIVFGSLRFQAQLDHLIFFYSRRRAEALESDITIALRMALFQLRYLERIPPHAAVHETVELVKGIRRAAAGLANAVLRKVRRTPILWPDRATELSCPDWLLRRWDAHFGKAQAEAIARMALVEPLPYIRVPAGEMSPEGLKLAETSVPGCLRVISAELLAGERQQLRLHDIGSQAVLPQLGLQEGQSYLDLCAAPGNKTRQALETRLSFALACDTSLRRLQMMPAICPRIVLDGTQPLPFTRKFDRIFIDAPCSGTGTCGRNPEIKWRVQEQDFAKFGEKQMQLIESALPFLAPNGKLLYATCSLEPEENEEVVRRVLDRHSDVFLESKRWRMPWGALATVPDGHVDVGDGFYGALFVRR